MSRALVILASLAERQKVAKWAMTAPVNTRVDFKAPKRSVPQNDRMWAMLTEVAQQVDYHDTKLTPDDWKLIFLDGLKREMRIVPNLDGNGFVNLGRSSSDLSKAEMADLITLIEAWGLQHGVVFSDHDQAVAA
jgi:hypothetical protein